MANYKEKKVESIIVCIEKDNYVTIPKEWGGCTVLVVKVPEVKKDD